MIQLPDAVQVVRKEGNRVIFEIGPLMPGYGATIANPLRRVLLSSLEGAAVTSLKIKGIDHEFSAIPGIFEDVIQIILNVKKLRFHSYISDPVILTLTAKGEGVITGANLTLSSDAELANPDQHLFTITEKKTAIEIEFTVERGRGYESVEQRQRGKLPIGVIAIDAIYSPVRLVNFTIEDIRVGQRIGFNKIILEIETDGTIQPEQALRDAADILKNHFDIVTQVTVPEPEEKVAKKPRKKKVEDK